MPNGIKSNEDVVCFSIAFTMGFCPSEQQTSSEGLFFGVDMNKMQKPELLTFTPFDGIKNYPVYANGEKLKETYPQQAETAEYLASLMFRKFFFETKKGVEVITLEELSILDRYDTFMYGASAFRALEWKIAEQIFWDTPEFNRAMKDSDFQFTSAYESHKNSHEGRLEAEYAERKFQESRVSV